MAEIKSWSQTAGSNNAASPDGAPEGMLPSGVNDTIRENMAAIRKWYDDAQWIDDGGTPTFVSATQFTLSGDKTPTFHVDRRVKCYGTTMGTLYGYITASSYAAPNTTVTVVLDSGSLTSNMSRVYYAALSKTNNSLPNNMFAAKAGSTTQTFDVANATSGAHAVNRNYGDARYAALAGVNTQTFNVAAATAGDHAVNRTMADGRYAALAGISTQVFSVAAATTGDHAVNRNYGDARWAALAGVNTQTFSVAAPTTGDHAVNRTTADGRYGQLATTNTWSLAQTFSVQPTAPSYGFAGSTAYLNADAANIGVKPPVNGKLFVTDPNNTYRPVVCGAAESSGEAVTLGQADGRYAVQSAKSISFTRDTSLASGTQAITGVGFTPSSAIFIALENGTRKMSVGMADNARLTNSLLDRSSASDIYSSNTNLIYIDQSATDTYVGALNSWDADGFTIGWTKTGATTGTVTVMALLFK